MLPCIGISGAFMNKFASKYMQYVYFSEFFYKFRTHFISGSHSSMLPKAEHSQRKSCLQSVPLRLSARRMCLHPCMMLLSRRPTLWIADLQSRKASAYPVFSSLFMLPTASVSSISRPLTNPLISSRQYLAFSFGTTLINQGRADPGQIINVMIAILIGSFSLAMMAPEVQGKSLSFLSCRTRSPYFLSYSYYLSLWGSREALRHHRSRSFY
jgi:hypothetical protein